MTKGEIPGGAGGPLYDAAMILLALLTLACGPAPCPAGSLMEADGLCHLDEEEAADASSEVDAGSPVWTGKEALAEVEAALSHGLPDAILLRDHYLEGISHIDPVCPMRESEAATFVNGLWFDDCYSDQGFHYDGLGIFEEQRTASTWYLSGVANFEITNPKGAVFAGGGEFALDLQATATGTAWTSRVGGVYHEDGAADWLGDDGEAGLYVEGAWNGEEAWVNLDGGVGFAEVDLAFRDLRYDEAVCPDSAQGELLVRDPGGHWFSLVVEDCSGCGTLSWHDEELGPACFPDALAPEIRRLAERQGAL